MLKSIQLLRAISAWMVVFYHVQQIYFQVAGKAPPFLKARSSLPHE